jgi:Common central domain of tyrosinase
MTGRVVMSIVFGAAAVLAGDTGPDWACEPIPAGDKIPQYKPTYVAKTIPRFSITTLMDQDHVDALDLFLKANAGLEEPQYLTKYLQIHKLHSCMCTYTNIHYDVAFLPFHRLLVHLYERLLNEVATDKHLMKEGGRIVVPYWEWEMPGNNTIPWLYANNSSLMPFDTGDRRMKARNIDHWKAEDHPDRLRYDDSPRFPHFMDNAADGGHALVHIKSGDPMETVEQAARDPLFFAHHANMDRFWSYAGPYWFKQDPPEEFISEYAAQKIYFTDPDSESLTYVTLYDLWCGGPSYGSVYPMSMVECKGAKPNLLALKKSGSVGALASDGGVAPKRVFYVQRLNLDRFPLAGHKIETFAVFVNAQPSGYRFGSPAYAGRIALMPSHKKRRRLDWSAEVPKAKTSDRRFRFSIAKIDAENRIVGEHQSLKAASIKVTSLK